MNLVRNRPTPEGIELGKEVARLADGAEIAMRKRFPDAKPRCASCAFRLGTIPNGCPETLMDAMKCVAESVPFLCHMSPKNDAGEHTDLCAGWAAAVGAIMDMPDVPKAPWEFSADLAKKESQGCDSPKPS